MQQQTLQKVLTSPARSEQAAALRTMAEQLRIDPTLLVQVLAGAPAGDLLGLARYLQDIAEHVGCEAGELLPVAEPVEGV